MESNEQANDKAGEQAMRAMGDQALLNSVKRQRDAAMNSLAQAEAKLDVLLAANQELGRRVEAMTAEIAALKMNRAQRRAAK